MSTLQKSAGHALSQVTTPSYSLTDYALVGLRWVIGWLFFSALWRRMILAPKLDPEFAGYVGHKFNHFLPGAIGIDGMIEFLVTHPDWLHGFLIVFTLIEGLVGLALLVGLLTRISALGVALLSGGILLGAGWLGTTCLDEWQIGVLGMAGSWVLMLSGSGPISLDGWLVRKGFALTASKPWRWLASGPLPVPAHRLRVPIIVVGVGLLALTLGTNQIFHGGVWGTLHNDSKTPRLYAKSITRTAKGLTMRLGRDQGPDSYGGFLTHLRLLDNNAQTLHTIRPSHAHPGGLQVMQQHYLNTVHLGPNSVHVPLGGEATLRWTLPDSVLLKDYRYVELETVAGRRWQFAIER